MAIKAEPGARNGGCVGRHQRNDDSRVQPLKKVGLNIDKVTTASGIPIEIVTGHQNSGRVANGNPFRST